MTLAELTAGEFSLVYNMLSLAIAAMIGSFAFFVMARQQLAPKYRPAMIMSSLVVGIAGYHYWRIFNSWEAAYHLSEAGNIRSFGRAVQRRVPLRRLAFDRSTPLRRTCRCFGVAKSKACKHDVETYHCIRTDDWLGLPRRVGNGHCDPRNLGNIVDHPILLHSVRTLG